MAKTSRPAARTSGFFALRTPLLPFGELLAWARDLDLARTAPGDTERFEQTVLHDLAVLRDRLRAIVQRPEVREALFVASPSLDEAITRWTQQERSEDALNGNGVELPVARYYQRMCGRCTPFGLFAACSLGQIADRTTLELAARAEYVKHTRLDMDYLWALSEALGRDKGLRHTLSYRTNTTLYRAAGKLRYAEAQLSGTTRTYHLVAVSPTDYLDAIIERARAGVTREEIVQLLVGADPDVTRADAEEFVDELIDTQVLVSTVTPPVTGPEPIHHFIRLADEHASLAQVGSVLRSVRDDLRLLDQEKVGSGAERYRAIAARLEPLPAKVELTRLFQVDLVKPATSAVLGAGIVDELVRAVEIGLRLLPGKDDRLAHFRRAFAERYGDREVPLVEVLDHDTGIGFERTHGAENTPLLEGLALASPAQAERSAAKRDVWLLRKLFELGPDANELVLSDADIDALAEEGSAPLPDAFAVRCAVLAASEEAVAAGRFLVRFDGFFGPSGAPMLGRFCHADPELARRVQEHLREEEAWRPDAVYAEIVHLPEGRLGNVLCRPVLREWEIAFMGLSGSPPDRVLSVEDLRVSVVGDRIVLRSARLGREILPRLTNAHAHSNPRNLSVYRFLAALQGQGRSQGWRWDWGLAANAVTKVPRVRHGKLVLAAARWTMAPGVLESLRKGSVVDHVRTLAEWRRATGAPRFLGWEDGDNELPVDFENALSLEAFAQVAKKRSSCVLVELLHETEQGSALIARGPEGAVVHEMIVPFVRTGDPPPRAAFPGTGASTPVGGSSPRSFMPGGEWLYTKVYTGSATADQVLQELVAPLVERLMASGTCDRWFFVRYGDPDWHLRLRLRGRPDVLAETALPMLRALAEPLAASGVVQRLVLDTYDREVERYGGDLGVDLSERLFQVDSEAVLAILGTLSGGEDARWQLALRGVDQLLDDLGLDLPEKRALTRELRVGFGHEFKADTTNLKHQLSAKFRSKRKTVETLLDRTADGASTIAPGLALLATRSERSAKIVAALRDAERSNKLTRSVRDLAKSFVHMHVNRLVRDAARAHELVIYDHLLRLYDSRAARSASNRSA